MHIPLVDLAAQQAEVDAEVRAGLDEVFKTTAFIGGPAVGSFERAYAEFIGVDHCIGVANGTDALELALRAAGVGPGGEVVIPANTFIATAEAVARIGAIPVLVDVDPTHLLMDVDQAVEAIGTRTQAVVPVHLFGQVAPVERLVEATERAGIPVIEDAAQAQGATRFGKAAGALGLAAATSFYPGKNLGAAGDAGAVTTDDPTLARQVRLMSAHGSEHKYVHEVVGMNSRLDTLQAVVLSAKLTRLARWNDLRRMAAARYAQLLADFSGVVIPQELEGNQDVWHLYVIRIQDRDRVLSQLQASGIGAGVHYPVPIHMTAAFGHLNRTHGAFPVAERSASQILSLPLFPQITAHAQERVVHELRRAVDGR